MIAEEEKQFERQLAIFKESLPHKPYCTDDVEAGLFIRPKELAIKRRIIQHNTPAQVKWLVFDYDKKDALGQIEAVNAPYPNILVTNKRNGHAHLFYSLITAVTRTDNAHWRPLNYLAKIEYSLGQKLGADVGYSKLVSKNPLHQDWLVTQLNAKSYELAELAEYLELPLKLPKRANIEGLGRNSSIFEIVRRIAYANVIKFKIESNFEAFSNFIYWECVEVNAEFPVSLHFKEVEGIAKSISKWTWKKYSRRYTEEKFSQIQTLRGYASGEARRLKNEDKREQAFKMRLEGATQRKIAEALEMSLGTINSWLKNPQG